MTHQLSTTALAFNRKIFWSLIALLFVAFGLYGYFISKSIINVLVREEIEQEIISVNSDISDLEFAYLNKKNTISLNFAYAQGFSNVLSKEFVERKSFASNVLTFNNGTR